LRLFGERELFSPASPPNPRHLKPSQKKQAKRKIANKNSLNIFFLAMQWHAEEEHAPI